MGALLQNQHHDQAAPAIKYHHPDTARLYEYIDNEHVHDVACTDDDCAADHVHVNTTQQLIDLIAAVINHYDPAADDVHDLAATHLEHHTRHTAQDRTR